MTAAALADFSSFIKQPERLITSSIEGERETDDGVMINYVVFVCSL